MYLGKFALLITANDPNSLMVFRDGVGRMKVETHTATGWDTTKTAHSGCPVDIMLEDETDA